MDLKERLIAEAQKAIEDRKARLEASREKLASVLEDMLIYCAKEHTTVCLDIASRKYSREFDMKEVLDSDRARDILSKVDAVFLDEISGKGHITDNLYGASHIWIDFLGRSMKLNELYNIQNDVCMRDLYDAIMQKIEKLEWRELRNDSIHEKQAEEMMDKVSSIDSNKTVPTKKDVGDSWLSLMKEAWKILWK